LKLIKKKTCKRKGITKKIRLKSDRKKNQRRWNLKKIIPNKNNTIERIRIKLERIKYYRGEIKNHLQYDRLKNDRD